MGESYSKGNQNGIDYGGTGNARLLLAFEILSLICLLRFRWVALQLSTLKRCPSKHAIKEQLRTLPKDLNETYDRILLKISQQDVADVKTFLRWLAFAARPMTLREIAETVTVDFNSESGPRYDSERRYRDERDVLEKCAGLITESKGIV